jgi:hypothetical protein
MGDRGFESSPSGGETVANLTSSIRVDPGRMAPGPGGAPRLAPSGNPAAPAKPAQSVLDRASTVLRLSWRHYTTTVSRGVIALLFSLDNWWEVRFLQRRVGRTANAEAGGAPARKAVSLGGSPSSNGPPHSLSPVSGTPGTAGLFC